MAFCWVQNKGLRYSPADEAIPRPQMHGASGEPAVPMVTQEPVPAAGAALHAHCRQGLVGAGQSLTAGRAALRDGMASSGLEALAR